MTLMRRMPTPGNINKKSNETETPVALAERAFFSKKSQLGQNWLGLAVSRYYFALISTCTLFL
ncbi:hypothetical protein AWS32_04005 [Enterobacter hormaechei subsp. xiangfangensis]|nr:hypothetical protein BFV63_11790 [Enterobacter hormaechei subsp. xiangfangensis]ATW92999.1 hypothetical protein CU081_15575 [Enterobacter sp. CRENT-193]AXQ32969.1 hypothetical protein D0Z05_05960 [Enterobacter hormaechei]OEH23109.1 hypothetical protein AN659_0223520 [Enterobacter sp. ST121:950178628]RYA44763.1 hypothetical protein DD603_02390 [Enterobacter cloacae complex sp. 2DZ2F2B]RYA45122.1 hypothetical protein DD605_08475 [Enterobacter cloacae complex sp. 3DZ3S2B]RYA60534.1 hypothetic